ncbi:glycosyltransferase [Cellulomonas sp. ATA003]|uniref:glycosyltransferase n=1 Tax=Cellulomonas sp. ATA003 TaxID=3073064 RepID=UPI002872C040|nr:glycosyltransferase [Cellulomonas sp. ATA003]WNB86324.1 glycosyltransferase [Cellulomonas sp. ATA003]
MGDRLRTESARPTARAVVVTWNGAHLLPACLDSLLGQTVADRLEVVVVDNASQDGTPELLRSRYPGVRLVTNPVNLGFAGGVVAGTRDVTADAVLLLNNDATLDPDGLERLLATLDAPGNERVGAVTAKILLDGWYRERPARGTVPAGAFRRGDVDLVPADPDEPGAVRVVNSTGNVVTRAGAGVDRDWLAVDGTESTDADVLGFCGGAALLRTSALAQVGGFDPDLFLYYEDTDVSWRMRAAGWTVRYEAGAVARHRHAASSDAASPLFRYYNTRNSLVVAGRHASLAVVATSAARQVAGTALAWLRRSEPRPVRVARVRALLHVARRSPRTLAERRAMWRSAAVGRAEVARYLV